VQADTVTEWRTKTEDLVRSVGAGFARLFERYAPRLRGYLSRRGVTGDRADDLVQEIMIAVWESAGRFDVERGTARSWIFTIARSKLLDGWRRLRRRPTSPLDQELLESKAPTAHAATELAEDVALLKSALVHLPAEQALVVTAVYVQGKSLSTIADEQQLPLGTVKTRARLAINRLRRTISTES
jgi:RNA polymerase sigma factor (sigma-70 family)